MVGPALASEVLVLASDIPHKTSICEYSPATVTIALMTAALQSPRDFSYTGRSLCSAGPARQYGNGPALSAKRMRWTNGES